MKSTLLWPVMCDCDFTFLHAWPFQHTYFGALSPHHLQSYPAGEELVLRAEHEAGGIVLPGMSAFGFEGLIFKVCRSTKSEVGVLPNPLTKSSVKGSGKSHPAPPAFTESWPCLLLSLTL